MCIGCEALAIAPEPCHTVFALFGPPPKLPAGKKGSLVATTTKGRRRVGCVHTDTSHPGSIRLRCQLLRFSGIARTQAYRSSDGQNGRSRMNFVCWKTRNSVSCCTKSQKPAMKHRIRSLSPTRHISETLQNPAATTMMASATREAGRAGVNIFLRTSFP